MHFHQKIWNQLKRTWHHVKGETLKKPCVEFEERKLNTLRVIKSSKRYTKTLTKNALPAARPDNPISITGFFLRKNPAKNEVARAITCIYQLLQDITAVQNRLYR